MSRTRDRFPVCRRAFPGRMWPLLPQEGVHGRDTGPRVRRRIGARLTRDLATGVQGLHHRVGTTEGAQVPHVVFLPQDRPHLGPPPEEGKRGPWARYAAGPQLGANASFWISFRPVPSGFMV